MISNFVDIIIQTYFDIECNGYHIHADRIGERMNKTLIAVPIAAVALVGLSAGAIMMTGNGDSDENPVDLGPSGPVDSPVTETGKVLVVYFSKMGTTQAYAERIAALTGADIVSIEPVNPCPSSYSETTDIAREELDSNARPAISTVSTTWTGTTPSSSDTRSGTVLLRWSSPRSWRVMTSQARPSSTSAPAEAVPSPDPHPTSSNVVSEGNQLEPLTMRNASSGG